MKLFSVLDFVGRLGGMIPPENATFVQRRRFDTMVALGGLAIAGALAFHISWAGGYLQYEDANGHIQGFSGFATTAQLAPVGSDVKSLLHLHERDSINKAREKIRDNRRRQCLAAMNGLPTDIYNDPIDEGVNEYRLLTNGQEFAVPGCEQFVVGIIQ